jgi:hypothetical protein
MTYWATVYEILKNGPIHWSELLKSHIIEDTKMV